MIIVWLLAGLVTGILVNYLADVLPRTRKLSRPLWWPIRTKKVKKYLATTRVRIILIAGIFTAATLYQYPPPNSPVLLYAAVITYFALVTTTDVEHRIVMHPVSILGALVLGAIGISRHGLTSTLLGGAVGFGTMLALYFIGDWLGRLQARKRGEKWKDTALGFGDVNLAGVIGLLMGWPGVISALVVGVFAAGIFGSAYLLWMMLRGKYSAFASIPYAPFLCFGAVFMFTVGLYASTGI